VERGRLYISYKWAIWQALGERPYSAFKITLLVLAIAILIGLLYIRDMVWLNIMVMISVYLCCASGLVLAILLG